MSEVQWDRVVSCVAGVEGLEVVERQGDGTLGAARNVPYSRTTGQRAGLGGEVGHYRLLHKGGGTIPMSGDAYHLYGNLLYAKQSLAKTQTESGGGCWHLERLDAAKPGYVSTWTYIDQTGCRAWQSSAPQYKPPTRAY
jgi:hypothetical protein